MGRPKSKKSRVQTPNSKSTFRRESAPTTEVVVVEQVQVADAPTGNGVDTISNIEQSLETATALMVCLQENESRSCEAEYETESSAVGQYGTQSEQISAILNQVENWMEDAAEVKDPLDQKLTDEPVINYENLDVVLPHYRTSQPRKRVESVSEQNFSQPSEEMMYSIGMLEERFEQMAHQIEQRLESFLGNFESRMERQIRQLADDGGINHSIQIPVMKSEAPSIGNSRAEHKSNNSEVDSSVPESDWERRKRELLVDFGLSRDEIDQIVPKKSDKRINETAKQFEASAQDNGQVNAEPAEAAVCFTSFEIDQLKEQLTAKLREAELELSINRAKLLQESTALEQRLADVTRREAALKSKYAEIEGTNKTGLLDRITRHLSRRPN